MIANAGRMWCSRSDSYDSNDLNITATEPQPCRIYSFHCSCQKPSIYYYTNFFTLFFHFISSNSHCRLPAAECRCVVDLAYTTSQPVSQWWCINATGCLTPYIVFGCRIALPFLFIVAHTMRFFFGRVAEESARRHNAGTPSNTDRETNGEREDRTGHGASQCQCQCHCWIGLCLFLLVVWLATPHLSRFRRIE